MYRNTNQNVRRRTPITPACGLIEDDNVEIDEDMLRLNTPSFPLQIFPESIRNIIVALEKYENYNADFTAASFFTVFASAMGNTWSVRFRASWISRPIIYMVLIGSPSCGKTPTLQQVVTHLLLLTRDSLHQNGNYCDVDSL